MRRVLAAAATIIVAAACVASWEAWRCTGAEPENDPDLLNRFYIFRDSDSKENHGNWTNKMPAGVTGVNFDVFQKAKVDPTPQRDPGKDGPKNTCVRLDVRKWNPESWIGIAVAGKPDYWGKESGPGFDLRAYTKLVFWARGQKGEETIQVKIAITGKELYGDSASDPVASEWISLTPEWKRYEIPLKNADLRRVITPFAVFMDRSHNDGENLTIFLDEIYLAGDKG